MCGIAGSVGSDPERAISHVESMVSRMAHRGPDAHGTRRLGPCVLGHSRLRVIDLSPAADQPLADETGAAWVVFNGEIYNHADLRRRLEGAGHTFRSRADTEVIVHLYEEEGPDLVHALEGMFAFALWDSRRARLLLARDRLGIKPLYYRRSGRGLTFASEGRALTTSGTALDPDSVRSYLHLGWVPGPSTIWAGVSELPPGHSLTWSDGAVDVRRYWSVPVPRRGTTREELAAALETSMRRQVVADVPVGLFLSSGVDSSVLAHLLARTGGRATAVTVAFAGTDGEEVDAARLAGRLGIDHVVARTEGGEILRSLPQIVGSLDQPSVDGVNTWVVSQAVRRAGMVVALSGLGGDELFGGYSTFRHVPRLVRLAGRAGAVPGPAWALGRVLLRRSERWDHGRGARAFDAVSSGGWGAAYQAVRGLLPGHDVEALLGPAGRGWSTGVVEPAGEHAGGGDEVRFLELANYLPFQLLRDTDAMSMAHALEVRVPLLDEAVVDAAGRLGKQDLAASVDADLARAAAGPKKTFTLPFDAWLRGPLLPDVGEAVLGLEGLGLERQPLAALWEGFRRRHVPWRPIWALAVLGMWADGQGRGGPAPPPVGARSVLLVGDKWPSREAGGLNRYVSGLGTALREQGVAARAAVLGPAPGAPGWVTADIADHRRLPSRVAGMARSAASAGATAEVVDVHFPLYAALPVLASPLRRRPLVLHFHGPWALESDEAGRGSPVGVLVKRAMERALQRRAGRTVTESAAFKQLLVESYGALPWDVEVIAPGVDLRHFSPGRPAARQALGLAADGPVVLSVRRLESRMGLDLLLRAWVDVAPSHPAATLVIAGTGSMAGELQDLSRAIGVDGSVRFLGPVDEADLATWYRAADFTVVPSTALEGYGLIVLESAACGTPVLVSDVGGLPEAAAGLGSSAVVPAGDVAAWARRIDAALVDPGGLPGSEACRAYAERFTWDAAARRHQDVYRRAAASPRARTQLRVAFVDHCAELSGGELSLLELVDALASVDTHTVLGAQGPLAGRLRRQGASVEVLEMDRRAREVRRGEVRAALPAAAVLGTAGYVVRLAVRLRRLRPDLVHTNSLKAAIYGGLAGRLAGIPVVWHVRDQLVPEEYPPLARRVVKALARTVPSGIVANSRSTLALLGDGLPPAAVVPSIVVPPRPAPRPRSDNGRAADLRLGVVGRLAPWKGQDVFLRAFADAFPDGAHRAVLVGGVFFSDHGFEEELRALADRLGLDGRVEFRGHRDDVWSELDRLDVFVHASVTPEPFGRVIVEAMAAGLPVVATRAGGPLELVDEGRTGLLVTPGDVSELSAALRELAASPELRASLGRAGHEASSRFGADVVVDGVLGLYGEVLRGGPARR